MSDATLALDRTSRFVSGLCETFLLFFYYAWRQARRRLSAHVKMYELELDERKFTFFLRHTAETALQIEQQAEKYRRQVKRDSSRTIIEEAAELALSQLYDQIKEGYPGYFTYLSRPEARDALPPADHAPLTEQRPSPVAARDGREIAHSR